MGGGSVVCSSVRPCPDASGPVRIQRGPMSEHVPKVVVYPPDDEGGRTVRIDGEVSGRAFSLGDVIEFLRRAGWLDAEEWPPIEWRGGGPEAWTSEPPQPV